MKQAPVSLSVVLILSHLFRAEAAVEVDSQFNLPVHGAVHAIAANSQKIFIGGEFQVSGTTRANLACLDSNGNLDPVFDVSPDAAVLSIAVAPDGSIYGGGSFNLPSRHILKVSADGMVDDGLALGASTSSRVDGVALGAGGEVAFGGPFRQIDGAAANYVGRLTAAGAIDSGFSSPLQQSLALEAGADAIAVQPDGKILAGGNFNVANKSARLVRLNADGSLDATFTGDHGPMLYPRAILVLADGRILVAGVASSSGNGFVRRLNTDGSVDPSFQAASFGGSVEAIAAAGDGGIIVGGSFSGGLTRLNPDGSKDSSWTISANGVVKAIAIQPGGAVLVGGAFSTIGNVERKSLARLLRGNAQQSFATNVNGRFVARLTGEEGRSYEIEASSDLLVWTGIGTAVASSAGIEVADDTGVARRHRFFRARLME